MENKDPNGNPIWLQALLTISSVTCVICFIIEMTLAYNAGPHYALLDYTFWVSLALTGISFGFWNSGGGRSSM